MAYPEVALNQKVKNLIQKLGEAIHESVSESENIAGVVKNIREQGFDVLLMLEATIGLNEVDMDEAESIEQAEAVDETIEGPFTTHDLTFLKFAPHQHGKRRGRQRSRRLSLFRRASEEGVFPECLPALRVDCASARHSPPTEFRSKIQFALTSP